MPRPRKWRRVCRLPGVCRFGPLDSPADSGSAVIMSVDEYETVRLIDMEGLTQEECAVQMDIARTTVQGIYNEARKKLAEFLVRGKVLWIKGGEYLLCNERDKCCGELCRGHRHGTGFPADFDKGIIKLTEMEDVYENSSPGR